MNCRVAKEHKLTWSTTWEDLKRKKSVFENFIHWTADVKSSRSNLCNCVFSWLERRTSIQVTGSNNAEKWTKSTATVKLYMKYFIHWTAFGACWLRMWNQVGAIYAIAFLEDQQAGKGFIYFITLPLFFFAIKPRVNMVKKPVVIWASHRYREVTGSNPVEVEVKNGGHLPSREAVS